MDARKPIAETIKNTQDESVEFSLQTASQTLTFIRPVDPEDILDQLTEEEFRKDECMPYWAEHWPASEAFIRYMCTKPPVVTAGSRIAELGAGLGTLSATLASLGNQSIATDISFQGCQYSRRNIMRYRSDSQVVCCDWRFSPFKSYFNYILGSDILYEKRWIEPIVMFLKHHLVDNGVAMIADPGRPYWELFKQTALSNGLRIRKSDFLLAKNTLTRIEILHLEKCQEL
ncbi:MAG: methyltransferase [Chitinivibrionales bacterium]|nr:methyltransferase [Chitinivibrionales bacterium]